MMRFLGGLRELSGGKPVGFKLCVGKRREFLGLCKAMHSTGVVPDFITVDGGEGGTGAAPLEFTNHLGTPLIEALIFVNNALRGFALRDRVRLFASGKVISAFDMVKRLALGADVLYSARGMMLSLGCIQALRCNSNKCPVGVATQDPELVVGLVPEDKTARVAGYHKEQLENVAEMLGAMGIGSSRALRPWHLLRRTAPNEVRHYGELYEFLERGALLDEPLPARFEHAVRTASEHSFDYTPGQAALPGRLLQGETP